MNVDATSAEETPVANESGPTTGGEPQDGPAEKTSQRGRWWWVAGVAIAALVVVVLAPLASRDPDGLERVAADQGFIDRASNFFSGILSGYEIPGISDPAVSTIVSGLIGVAIVVGVMYLLGRLLARRRA
ncbi:MAG: PDGLE domain-containing protein [Chloroflexi bacterium]|nr:PDGLE domain-containing protein [Chloroflexota bacterium]